MHVCMYDSILGLRSCCKFMFVCMYVCVYRICCAGVVVCLGLWAKLVWVSTDPGMVDTRFKDFDEVQFQIHCVTLIYGALFMYVCMYVRANIVIV